MESNVRAGNTLQEVNNGINLQIEARYPSILQSGDIYRVISRQDRTIHHAEHQQDEFYITLEENLNEYLKQ